MNIWLKRILFSLVLALLVAVVGLAIFLLTFNPNAYKSRLEQLVFDRYARTLTIEGDIGLSLFPRIGLSVNQVSLSNRQADDTFVSVESARFAVAIWPLLSNQLVVDHVAITGLKAWVVRDSKGQFNFKDLLSADGASEPDTALVADPIEPTDPGQDQASTPLAGVVGAALAQPLGRSEFNIDIAGLELKDGQIHYLDQADGLSTTLSGIEANTGRVTFDQPFDVSLKAKIAGADPVQDARLQAQALLQLNPAERGYSAQKINVQILGRLGHLDQADATLKGNLAYKGGERRFAADNLELVINGNIVGAHPLKDLKASLTAAQLRLDQRQMELKVAKLAVRAAAQDQDRQLELALDAPALSVSPQSAQADPLTATLKSTGEQTLAVSVGLEGLSGNANEWQFRTAGLDAALTQKQNLLRLKLTSPLIWDTNLRKGALTALKGDFSLLGAERQQAIAEFPMIGSLSLDLIRDALDTDLSAIIDGGQASFKSSTTHLADPQTTFALNAEKINLNHWLPLGAEPDKAPGKPAETEEPSAAPEPAAAVPKPMDFSWLKRQTVQGDVRIADLLVRDLQLTQLQVPVQLADGVLMVPGLAASLYDGSLSGQLRVAADQTLALKLKLDKVSTAPLMQAAFGRNYLSGPALLQLDLAARGNTLDAWRQTLDGHLAWQMRDGAVHGVDAAQTLSEVAASLGNIAKGRMDAVPSPFDSRRSTPFSALDGRVDFKQGQGQLSKLLLNADLVRVTAGQPALINVPDQQLDLQLRVQVATRFSKSLQAQLGGLAGVMIPVQLTGNWDNPAFAVQWDDIRNQTIQGLVKSGLLDLLKGDDPIERVLPLPETDPEAVPPSSGNDPVERIGNALKGLLGQ